jgi:hypothetical protein
MSRNYLDTAMTYKGLRIMLFLILFIIIFLSVTFGIIHLKKCNENKQSSFLWGASVCNVEYDSTTDKSNIKTLPHSYDQKTIIESPEISHIKIKNIPHKISSKEDTIKPESIKAENSQVNTGTNNGIVGNNNTVNVNMKNKDQRHLEESDKMELRLIIEDAFKKNSKLKSIVLSSVSGDEPNTLAREILNFLKINKYPVDDNIGTIMANPTPYGIIIEIKNESMLSFVIGYNKTN